MTETNPKFKLPRKQIIVLIKLLLACIIMWVLIKRISIDQIILALRQANLLYIALTVGLLFLNIFFQFKKWQLLVKLVKPTARAGEVLSSLFAGYALGLVTPGRVGEFGRSVFIRNADWRQLTGLVIIDKLFAMVMVYLFGLAGFAYFLQLKAGHLLWQPLLIALVILLLLIIFLILHPDLLRTLLMRFKPRLMKIHFIEKLTSAYSSFTHRHAYTLFGFAACHVFTYLFQFYLLIKAFAEINLLLGLLAVAATFLAKTLLPISFGDLGVRETAAIYFFSQLGITRAAAFNASFILFIINILIPSTIGMVVILLNRNMGKNVGLNS